MSFHVRKFSVSTSRSIYQIMIVRVKNFFLRQVRNRIQHALTIELSISYSGGSSFFGGAGVGRPAKLERIDPERVDRIRFLEFIRYF